MAKSSYDLVVIGAGSAGLTAAEFSAQLGQRVALIEKVRIGGDCTWSGCVPSKALLKAAKLAHQMRTSQQYGLGMGEARVDFSAVMERVSGVVDQVYQGETPEVLQGKGIEVIEGSARFLDSKTLAIEPPNPSEASFNLTARRFIIATGAKPFVPPIPGLEEVDYLTYETVWALRELPARLIVVGAGPIGCELAQAFCRLGSSVILIEGADRILLQDEPEVAELLSRQLTQEGVDLRLGSAVQRAWQGDDGIHVDLGGSEVVGDALLMSVGRSANVTGLGLDEAGVAYTAKGIQVNNRLRTSQKRILAAGDCAGGFQFTHYAAWQGFMAVRNALMPGLSVRAVLDRVPWTTFTDPEVAHVGYTESQARAKLGSSVVVSTFPMERVDRAITEGDTSGFIKVIHRPNGKILGATIVSARAGEMIHEYALAMDKGLRIRDLAESIHVYPTYSLGTMQLAAQVRVDQVMEGTTGKFLKGLTKLAR